MSIIHDALKKVQQGLKPKIEEIAPPPSGTSTKGSTYIYATPPAVGTLTETTQKAARQKPPVKKKIESVFITTCVVLITVAITIASIDYILQQFQTDIPKVKNLAQRSFSTLIHKKVLPPQLTSLAQLTINSTQAAPITLNIHGIMANSSGNLALINDQVYQAGDEVDGAKIVKIDLDSITVNINGTEKTIFVKN